jgi:hypothetical protein
LGIKNYFTIDVCFAQCFKGSSGELLAVSDEILSETTEQSVTQKDITPLWKKGLETWINTGASKTIYKI